MVQREGLDGRALTRPRTRPSTTQRGARTRARPSTSAMASAGPGPTSSVPCSWRRAGKGRRRRSCCGLGQSGVTYCKRNGITHERRLGMTSNMVPYSVAGAERCRCVSKVCMVLKLDVGNHAGIRRDKQTIMVPRTRNAEGRAQADGSLQQRTKQGEPGTGAEQLTIAQDWGPECDLPHLVVYGERNKRRYQFQAFAKKSSSRVNACSYRQLSQTSFFFSEVHTLPSKDGW